MDVLELKELKKELVKIYNDEQSLKNNNNAELMDEELKYIKREIDKVDSLIDIYKDDNIKYRVMMLERLYMQTMMDMSKEKFDKISIEEENDIFDNLFPDSWVLSIPIEKKQDYLEEAICSNKVLNQICPKDNKRKNNIFLKRWVNEVSNEK